MNKIKLTLLLLCVIFINFQIGSVWADYGISVKNHLRVFWAPAKTTVTVYAGAGGKGSFTISLAKNEERAIHIDSFKYGVPPYTVHLGLCQFSNVNEYDNLSVNGVWPFVTCTKTGP